MTGYTTRDGRSWTAHWEVGSVLTRGAGRQKQKGGFRSRRDANRFLATAVAGRADAGRLKPSRRPLAEYLTEQWLPHAAAKVRPTTLIFYKQMVNHHIASREIGSLPICDITPLALNALYRDLARCRDPACVHDDVCSGLSAATCVSVHGVLNRALADAARWDLLPGNPAAMADGPVRRPAEMPVWTVFKLERFLQFAVRDRLYALWQLAAATGMRRGELLGLTWPDVDLKQGSVRIQRQLLALEGAIAVRSPQDAQRGTHHRDRRRNARRTRGPPSPPRGGAQAPRP
jgi:integrase